MTTVPDDYLFFAVEGVSIQCVTSVCASEFAWAYVTLDGGYILSTDENWDNSLIDWSREDERYVYSRAPYDLGAFVGSAPGLQDIGPISGDGFYYGSDKSADLGSHFWMLPFPQGLKTIYVTFLEVESRPWFYNVDEASIGIYWEDVEAQALLFTTIEGRLFSPISQDPISQVPLPGSLLFILSSMAAASGLALRKGRASFS
jgi:hypothetical protein